MPPKKSTTAPVTAPVSAPVSAPTKTVKTTKARSTPVAVTAPAPVPTPVPEPPAPVPEPPAPAPVSVPESPAPTAVKAPRKKPAARVAKPAAVSEETTGKGKKTVKKVKDPAEPKRYCSAYILYSNDNRQKIKDANPTASATEVMSLLGAAWKAVDEETKAMYEQMSADSRVKYESDMASFKETHPQAGGAKAVDPNKPKRGSTAYILFSNDQRAAVKAANPSASAKEVMSLLGAAWKAADESTKARFEDLASKDRVRYESEMTAYKA
jgi:hypothetical protein